ncbi:MAG TPA: UrcA family protein [Steroidobacteraceae bacterium]|jgi:UrcA family protein
MTRSINDNVLHRASERVSAGAAAIALTFLTLLTVDARADAQQSPPSISVSYSDVSFATTAGAAKVYGKLKAAARQVCGVNDGVKDIAMINAAHQCYREALADAVQRIDRPTLTALHVASSHKYG